MPSDGDTYLVETSAGELTVQYGWNRWVSVRGSGLPTKSAVIGNRRGLVQLLVAAGLPEAEANSLATRLWKDRPRSAMRRAEPDAWDGPWKQHPYGTLIVFVGLAAAFVYIVVLKLDWVGA
jgi:hypothetical protein